MSDSPPDDRRPPHSSRDGKNRVTSTAIAVVIAVVGIVAVIVIGSQAGQSRQEELREENYQACLADPDGWDSTDGADDWNEEDSLLDPEDLCDIYPGRPD